MVFPDHTHLLVLHVFNINIVVYNQIRIYENIVHHWIREEYS